MGTMAYFIFTVLVFIPFWMFLPKFRLPQWLALCTLIPFTLIPLLWVMAFRDKIKIPGIDK